MARSDQYVVNVHARMGDVLQNPHNHALKHGGSVLDPHGEHRELVGTPRSDECREMPTFLVQVHLMEPIFEVKDRPQPVLGLLADQVLDQWQREWVILGLTVQVPIIDHHSPLFLVIRRVRLRDHKCLRSPFALGGSNPPSGQVLVDDLLQRSLAQAQCAKGFTSQRSSRLLELDLGDAKGAAYCGVHIACQLWGMELIMKIVLYPFHKWYRIRMLACARNDTADLCQCFLIRELPINSQIFPWRRSQLRRLSGCVPCGIEQYCAQ